MIISEVFPRFGRTRVPVSADYTGDMLARIVRPASKGAPMSEGSRTVRVVWLSVTLALFAGGAVYAHTYIGLHHERMVGARVQSPNANVVDKPVPIPGTDLSVVCFRVRNTGPADTRITAIGLDLPGEPTGFTLISPTDGNFRLIEQVHNVPGMPDVTLDFALVTGRTFPGGRPADGLAPSTVLTTFCVSGPFDQNTAIERLLDRGVLRLKEEGDDELGDVLIWESRPAQ
jgi:hypothetical protein